MITVPDIVTLKEANELECVRPTYEQLAKMLGRLTDSTLVQRAPKREVPEALVRRVTYKDEIRRDSWIDHPKLWTGIPKGETKRRPVAFTSEPYGLDEFQIDELIAFRRRLGLNVRIESESPHHPGCVVITLWKAKRRGSV